LLDGEIDEINRVMYRKGDGSLIVIAKGAGYANVKSLKVSKKQSQPAEGSLTSSSTNINSFMACDELFWRRTIDSPSARGQSDLPA